jgi:hypothetical protein
MPDHKSSKPYGGGRTDRPSSIFLDTRGNTTLGVGICARCNFKFPLGMLMDDPNALGLKVCSADRDDFDPNRMPARQADVISLPFVRPDTPLTSPPTPPWEQ